MSISNEGTLNFSKSGNKSKTAVNSCAEDIINYIQNDAEIAMPIDELMHPDGTHLSKKQYGHVLLKYLVKELRERYY
jgi:hypothetical protein